MLKIETERIEFNALSDIFVFVSCFLNLVDINFAHPNFFFVVEFPVFFIYAAFLIFDLFLYRRMQRLQCSSCSCQDCCSALYTVLVFQKLLLLELKLFKTTLINKMPEISKGKTLAPNLH